MGLHQMTKKQLLDLPQWDFENNGPCFADALIMIRGTGKHSSGYSFIATIAEIHNPNKHEAFVIGRYSDAIHFWSHFTNVPMTSVNIDCLYPSGAFRTWSPGLMFKIIGEPMSDAIFDVVRKKQ